MALDVVVAALLTVAAFAFVGMVAAFLLMHNFSFKNITQHLQRVAEEDQCRSPLQQISL